MDVSTAKALVTGGSSGIGLETARQLRMRGAQVAICGRDEARVKRAAESIDVVPIVGDVSVEEAARLSTGISELDRVLGGGLVPASLVLLGGEPGVGKSTLLLEVAARAAAKGAKVLYVTAEESVAQVRMRAERTGGLQESLMIAAETDLGTILGHIEQVGEFDADDDATAVAAVERARGSAEMELWRGTQKVMHWDVLTVNSPAVSA